MIRFLWIFVKCNHSRICVRQLHKYVSIYEVNSLLSLEFLLVSHKRRAPLPAAFEIAGDCAQARRRERQRRENPMDLTYILAREVLLERLELPLCCGKVFCR